MTQPFTNSESVSCPVDSTSRIGDVGLADQPVFVYNFKCLLKSFRQYLKILNYERKSFQTSYTYRYKRKYILSSFFAYFIL
jgi:hypothetical protein